MEITKTDGDIIPLFVKFPNGELKIIPSNSHEVEITEGSKLVYLGKKINLEREHEEEFSITGSSAN